MAIYYVERDYKIEIVPIFVKCPECELNMEVSVYSNQEETTEECECCGRMLEIKIFVCTECNSSANIVDTGSGKYFCNNCEKLV